MTRWRARRRVFQRSGRARYAGQSFLRRPDSRSVALRAGSNTGSGMVAAQKRLCNLCYNEPRLPIHDQAQGISMPKTIFVIDDDENMQTVLDIALTEDGYDVELASNGEDALRQLDQILPDLVLCDVMMPFVDGTQVWRVVREQLQYAGVPFVLMTALDRKPWFAALEAEGVVILHKPFDIEHLVALVRSSLGE